MINICISKKEYAEAFQWSASEKQKRIIPWLKDMIQKSQIHGSCILMQMNYGHAMSQPLPTGGFRWLDGNEINDFDVQNVSDNSEKGYILQVDLEYPKELHDEHDSYPLAPERLKVNLEWMSKYQKD